MTIDKEHLDGGRITQMYNTTSSVAIEKYQLVLPGADADTVTGTTSAAAINWVGRANKAVSSGDAGTVRVEVEILCPGKIYYLKNGGTCTFGSSVELEGNDGRVADMGSAASADGQKRIGKMMGATTSTDGAWVPILIGG